MDQLSLSHSRSTVVFLLTLGLTSCHNSLMNILTSKDVLILPRPRYKLERTFTISCGRALTQLKVQHKRTNKCDYNALQSVFNCRSKKSRNEYNVTCTCNEDGERRRAVGRDLRR